ncbi:response regulator [Steroidobacter sp. S1-65]|uniref:histidine kinase n=1 Tax=Steroidobacter gossypii TaxID=2805490 RepID=A0ABS1WWZ4_9GAMM|nr:response regulator [Steroidobacter gossypii]MBM0105491.1 response regulator [Steroidobacter gossypii]
MNAAASITERVNILLVDDQPSRLLSYESVLAGLGQNLISARSGEQALQRLLEDDFAVILLDVSMPGMDGFETAAMIHDHPRFESIPIIFVTGVHDSEFDALKGYRLGAVDYVSIPIVPEILRSKVSVLVELYVQRRELQRLNRSLAEANATLQNEKARELERVNRNLEQANAALRDADRHKDEFIAILAHELRNPLAPIRAAVDVMSLMPLEHPQLRWAREVIDRQTTHLSRLVDDLLDVSRISRGTIKLNKELLTLRTILDRSIEAAQPIISAHQHQLQIDSAGDHEMVEGDPTRLVQILSNLLNNAAKYMQTSGTIQLRARVEGSYAVFSVKDSGIGLTSEALPKLFNLFSRVHEDSGHLPSGLGIGLALVRQLVELHGGTVTATSPGPNLGSEFTVRLPLMSGIAPPAPVEPEPAAIPAAAQRLRVLVADDNADALESLAMLLEICGHEVRKASDGAETLQALSAWRPDVALLDIGMPILDGYEVARRIRSEPWGSRLFLVAVSGWGQSEDLQRASDAGFDLHFRKPIGLPALEDILDKAQRLQAETTVRS